MRSTEFIRAVADESARQWEGSDLSPGQRLEMVKIAHHLRGCRSCRRDFDILMESATDLSGVSLGTWVCDRAYIWRHDTVRGCVREGVELRCRSCRAGCEMRGVVR